MPEGPSGGHAWTITAQSGGQRQGKALPEAVWPGAGRED
jgi:hypothetical protein